LFILYIVHQHVGHPFTSTDFRKNLLPQDYNEKNHRAGDFKQSLEARNRVRIGLSPELEILKSLWWLGTEEE
jgi:hypothetical protein